MNRIKVLNNSRYHDQDLQDIADLFCDNNPKWGFRWGSDKFYDLTNGFMLVVKEANFSEGSFYLSPNQPQERALVGRFAWKSPHRLRLMNTDKIVKNPVEALTLQSDQHGHSTAGHQMAAQVYYALDQRFSPNRYHRMGEDIVSIVDKAGKERRRPYTVRYRIGTKRRTSTASREVDFQHNARLKQSNMSYRADQAFRGLAKLAYEAEQLLKLTKGRTEGLNFDPDAVRKMVEQLYGVTLPLVNSYLPGKQK